MTLLFVFTLLKGDYFKKNKEMSFLVKCEILFSSELQSQAKVRRSEGQYLPNPAKIKECIYGLMLTNQIQKAYANIQGDETGDCQFLPTIKGEPKLEVLYLLHDFLHNFKCLSVMATS